MEKPRYESRENIPERIALPALRYRGVIYVGYIHGAAAEKLEFEHPDSSNADAVVDIGFITNTGRFIGDRGEAFKIANTAGQLDYLGKKISERESTFDEYGSDFLMDKYNYTVDHMTALANKKTKPNAQP